MLYEFIKASNKSGLSNSRLLEFFCLIKLKPVIRNSLIGPASWNLQSVNGILILAYLVLVLIEKLTIIQKIC